MAGRQQHTIPRFVLKGFQSRVSGQQVFIWLYRRGSQPIETNTKNVGTERDFYGKPVDDQITEVEVDHYSPLLDTLRSQQKSGPVSDAEGLPELIAHLSTRTRSLRQSMEDSAEFFFEQLCARFTNKETLANMLSGPVARQKILDELALRGLSAEQAQSVAPLLQPLVVRTIQDALPEMSEYAAKFLTESQSRIPEMVRNAHLKGLAARPDRSERAESYRAFNWYVLKAEIPLVLGDTVCVFETNGERRFKPFDDADEVRRVFLPLSSRRVLVGTPHKARPKLDPVQLNKAAVRCSYEVFVSSVQLRSDSPLPLAIGKWSGVHTRDELRAICSNFGRE